MEMESGIPEKLVTMETLQATMDAHLIVKLLRLTTFVLEVPPPLETPAPLVVQDSFQTDPRILE